MLLARRGGMSGRVRNLQHVGRLVSGGCGWTDVHRALMSAWEAPGERWKIWCGVGLRWAGKEKGGDVGAEEAAVDKRRV